MRIWKSMKKKPQFAIGVEASLRRRRRGDAVRLEVCGEVKDNLLDFVLTSVELEPKDVYRIDGHLDCRMYFNFVTILALTSFVMYHLNLNYLVN